MTYLTKLIKNWFCENILFLLMMVMLFAGLQYFHFQERNALVKAAQQAEILKLKVSMIMELKND
ncbi:MAG: hypothetical protein WA981_04135 [Glaciecola sp.]